MKKTAKKLLSMALVLVMVLSMLPAVAVPALATETTSSGTGTGTKDAFGISTPDWTAEEKATAEADLPFGTGYGTWTTLYEKNELFFSMGYDSDTRLTGLFDWNGTEGTTVDTIVSAVDNFGQGKLTSEKESYKAVATAAMDLNGTGKKEYVANLALNTSDNALYLYVTDSNNNAVDATQYVEFKYVKQLSSMEVHQLNGAFSIAAGDFDGDGKDTIVVYIPRTDVSGYTKNSDDDAPFIAEYFFDHGSDGKWKIGKYSTVSSNVLTMLCNNITDQITTMKNQPMVDLVAEDVDKDGYDELIVTGSMNDVTNSDCNLGSQLFIYDRTSSGWNRSYWSGKESDRQIRITSDSNRRIVWASSTVGNVMVNTSTTSVDYPEIVTAGFVDKDNGQHINVDGDDKVGVQVVQAKSVKNQDTKNVICEYGVVFNQEFSPNGWTKGGFYESEDVNGLLQVQAYADRGLGQAESVFISGSVYRINGENKLEEAYKHDDFKSKDDFAPGGRTLTNTSVTAVTAGNFDGNDEGREQLICVTTLKQSGKNNAYSRVYCYYAEDDGTCNSKRSNYLTEHKGNFYVSLNALDTDNDSIIAKLESIERDYSAPDVLAILEASPYFAEINDSVGNSETTYGDSKSSGSGSTNTFGFTFGVSVGYEFESDLIQSGGGFEIAVDNAFNWGTANTTTVEIFREFRNDSGENLVVVYRCPVVTYRYVDLNGNELVVEKVGSPATSMITVDEYNEAAEQYAGLDPIDETTVKLGDPGDPFSYRSSTDGLTNAVEFNSAAVKDKWDDGGWSQYYGSGSIMQGLTITQEQEKTFSYDLSISKNVFLKVGGVTAGTTYGFTYGYENTHISGSSVTKSGAVTGAKEDGYDFQWKFAAWNCTLNGNTVPVLGYVVKDVTAPPSPAMGLTAESFTTDSVTLRWSAGTRRANQYRIYRVLDDTDGTHVLVGAVQGDEYSFTLTGLRPDETYTYVVCGVGWNTMESVDSAPITVRTQSEDSSVTLSLYGSSLTGSTLQSTGASAGISVQVSGASGSCSYQWQLLESGAEGVRHGWLSVDVLAGETIGTVKGATSGSLTLKNIDESLSGSSLRCVVTVTSTAGDVDTYYSPVATLDLSGLDTTTTISVSGDSVTGNGSIAAPYTGMANYTTVTEESSGSYVNVPATVTDSSGKTFTIYQDATDAANPVYVGVYDAATGTSSRTYCAVTKDGETYSLGSALTLADDQYICASDYTIPEGFDGTSGVYKESDPVRYEKRYVVGSGSPITLTEYWYNVSDGQYYNKTESGFALADPQPDKTVDAGGNETLTNADLRIVYYEYDGTVILSADGDDSYDHYEVYTAGESSYTAGASFYRLPGTMLKNGDASYADSAKLTTVTVQKAIYNTVTASVDGTQLKLSATVDPSGGGLVTFTITNTDTGTVTQLTTTSGTAITWRAPKAGLYRIVATAAATATTKSSSAVCYYRADDPNSSYRLTVTQGSAPVTNISYSGSPVTPVLWKRTDSDSPWSASDETVTYLVNGETITSTNNSYTPGAAGSYTFSAVVGGKTVATAMLVVNKVPITVTPTWDGTVPANISNIDLAVTDAQGSPSSVSVDDYVTVSCNLYGSNGAINSGAQSGVYTVNLNYVDAKKAEFLSRYSVTLNTGSIYYFSDKIAVHFEAGENGTVSARYIDPSGTEFSFSNDSQVSMDYRLKFVAVPNSGCSVDKWTVTVGSSSVDTTTWYTTYGNTLEFKETGMAELKEANAQQINVSVSFANNAHTITYSAGTGGSLSAAAGDDDLISGASVTHDAAVTFTAVPNSDMMVDKWIVDGADYTWPGTDAFYRENTLTLENIAADHDVQVLFTTAATTEVSASAVDTNSIPYSGATITVTDADGSAITGDALKSVSRSGALTFTAAINNPSSAVVRKWQTSTDNVTWTTVTGSGGQDTITVYQHDSAKLYVRVVITVTQTYKLSWKAMEGETAITDTTIANLIVRSGNDALGGNGSFYAANIPVTFTLSLSDAYELVGWSDNVTADGTTATLSSLTADTTVTVTVRKKPTVTIRFNVVDTNGETAGGTNGTLTAAVGANSLDDGGTAYVQQTVTFTAAPDAGYRVKEWTLNGAVQEITGNTFTLPLDASMVTGGITVTVQFMPTGNQLMFYAGDNGSIQTVTVNGTSYDFANGLTAAKDAQVVITAAPDTGYEVKAWKVNGVTQADETGNTFTYTADGTNGADITVEFQSVAYTVRWTAKNGTVTAAGQTASPAQIRGGETVTFTAAANDGYVFDHWVVNGAAQGETNNTFTWTVPTGQPASTVHTVEAVFERENVQYTVTYGTEGSGTIRVPGGENGSVTVASGGSVTFTATPAANYMVQEWQLDGVTIPDTANRLTYELTNVMGSHRVTVVFKAAVLYKVGYGVDGSGGTLAATANGESLTLAASVTADIPAGSKLVFTATPAVGDTKYMVAQWTVNGTPVTRDNMAQLGVTLEHYLSNTLTVESLSKAMNIQVSFTAYTAFAIPGNGTGYTVEPGTRNPAEPYAGAPAGEVRENGDVSFTVRPNTDSDYITVTKLIINGYDCIAGELTEGKTAPDNCLSVAAVKNTDGSYTVTVTGVTGTITTDIEANKVVVSSLTVPAAFEGIEELDSVDEIQAKLETKLTGSADNQVFYDIALKYYDSETSAWVEVTAANFPAGGVDVVLPYPDGTDSKDTFTIVHMLTTTARAGEMETVSYTKQADGLHFHVTSLSPFGVSWTKYTAPAGGGSGGGGGGGGGAASTTETITIKDSVNGKVTADNTNAEEGDTVTLTVEPDKGYTLETLTVTDGSGKEVKLTAKDGKYTFTMPASKVTIKATFMEDNSMLNFFVDVPADAYYYDAVLWAAENGITGGVDDTHFAPYASCTRAQAVTFLWRAAGSPAPKSEINPFTDVKADAYYYDAVLWAVEQGITSGTSATTFSPDATCTRGQIVTFLWRAQKSPAADGVNPFTDVAADAYYANAVLWAVENGVTSGTTATTFSPISNCTRAQIVTFLFRCLGE